MVVLPGAGLLPAVVPPLAVPGVPAPVPGAPTPVPGVPAAVPGRPVVDVVLAGDVPEVTPWDAAYLAAAAEADPATHVSYQL